MTSYDHGFRGLDGDDCRWNASRAFASYLDAHPELYRDRSVLELGAGGGLPGLVTAKNGANAVSDIIRPL